MLPIVGDESPRDRALYKISTKKMTVEKVGHSNVEGDQILQAILVEIDHRRSTPMALCVDAFGDRGILESNLP